jgi:hypothetical protein
MEHERACRDILAHRQPGDIVITASPMAGAIVLNGVDYYLQSRVGFGELYMTAPAVVDRWSGGHPISKPVSSVRISEKEWPASISTARSTSRSERSSPRATEPNTAR